MKSQFENYTLSDVSQEELDRIRHMSGLEGNHKNNPMMIEAPHWGPATYIPKGVKGDEEKGLD